MTRDVAIYNFFNSFGCSVQPEGDIFVGRKTEKLPRIILPDFTYYTDGEKQERSLEIWNCGPLDWFVPKQIEEKIAAAIPLSGRSIEFEGGAVHLRRGKPFSKPIYNKSGDMLRGIRINLTYEYINPKNRLKFTLGDRSVTIGDGSRIIVSEGFCGGRAESICGSISADCIGLRRQISAWTDWIPTSEINLLSAMAAQSPIMTVEYPFDDGTGIVLKTDSFFVEVPQIKEQSRTGGECSYCRAEIRAVSRGVTAK